MTRPTFAFSLEHARLRGRFAAAILSTLVSLASTVSAAPRDGQRMELRRAHPAATQSARLDAATEARLNQAFGRLPLAFEENRGQAGPEVRFLSRGPGYTLLLTSNEAALALHRPEDGTAIIRMKLLGANAEAEVAGLSELPGKTHYLVGSDPAAWRRDVPSYAQVRYQGAYPGVDLLFHGSNQGQLEYDVVVAPGADPAAVRLGFAGASRLALDPGGDLVLHTAGGEVIERAPLAYQEVDGRRLVVSASYEIRGENEIGFRVGAYDRSKALIIDPVLAYSTYLGGSAGEGGVGIAVDAAGSAYVTGVTGSTNFPTSDPLQLVGGGFVTKFSPAGNSLVYSTYLGGTTGGTSPLGIAVDGSGSAYLAGQTCASDFPTVNPVQSAHAGGCDAFVAKLSPQGNGLAYATFLGGSVQDKGNAIAVDGAGSAYVAGFTFSSNFPTANAFQGTKPPACCFTTQDGFVAKLSPAGSSLVYSTYLGGDNLDDATSVAVDGAGSAYVTGTTFAANFPTFNALQPTKGLGQDVFVTKLSPAGSSLVYSTYLGGTGGAGIAVDGAGSAYLTGLAHTDLPLVNPIQTHGGAFVAKLAPAGTSLVYSTRLGGTTSADRGRSIALDPAGNAYVTGWTLSADFPTIDAVQCKLAGHFDSFVTKVSAAGDAFLYSTYLGGNDDDFIGTGGNGIAVDVDGNAYVTGSTRSTNFPTVNAFQGARSGGSDAYVYQLAATPPSPTVPIADAGPDQAVDEGTTVTLAGSARADPCDVLGYHWEQLAGPAVTLTNPGAAQTSFEAPTVSAGNATLTFQLTVDDGVDLSEPDTVDVTVKHLNQTPVADAGDDQTVQEGSTVTLHGGDSFDPDGESLTYSWTQTSGPAVSLSDSAAAEPTFTAPPVGSAGESLVFHLTVSDGREQFTDEVTILVSNVNQAPIAHAGSDQTADEGTVVTLDAAGSVDPDADALTYTWTQIAGPPVTLSEPASAMPSFTAPDVGPSGETLVFQVVAHDGAADSEPDVVEIHVRDASQPPACALAQASPSVLWPPDHKLVEVAILGVADPEDADVHVTATAVTQDEPVNGLGDGDTSPDAVLQDDAVLLRAERSGQGTGRVYRVTFTAEDAAGAACTGEVVVCVPHDRRDTCLDEGERYDSLLP